MSSSCVRHLRLEHGDMDPFAAFVIAASVSASGIKCLFASYPRLPAGTRYQEQDMETMVRKAM